MNPGYYPNPDTKCNATTEQGSEPDNDVMDPNDSNSLRNQINGQTVMHAQPPRLEDEGQSGG